MSSSSGEKTEQPTEKKLRDARKKGQIAKSQDLTSSLMLLTAVTVFWLGGAPLAAHLTRSMQQGIQTAAEFNGTLTQEKAFELLFQACLDFAFALAPLFVCLFIGGILFNFVQVGSMFAFDSIKPELSKLNPAEGFKQKFMQSRSYIELGKTVLKIIITFAVAWSVLQGEIPNIVKLLDQSAGKVFLFTFDLVLRVGFYVSLLFVGLAVGDYFLQRLLFLQQMKMTKEEVKREYKESEGDPLIKWLRKSIHQEILSQSSVAAVKTADVVIVNPTHIAVALKYDRETMGAPTVVAKGADLIAKQIRDIAKNAEIPMMRDVPLARTLYEFDLDSEIPEELYETVAVVLRWVYNLNDE